MKCVVPEFFSVELEDVIGFEWPRTTYGNSPLEFKIFLKGGKEIAVKAKSINKEDAEILQEKFMKLHNAWVGVEEVITP